jgi:hypothetical protein
MHAILKVGCREYVASVCHDGPVPADDSQVDAQDVKRQIRPMMLWQANRGGGTAVVALQPSALGTK